MTQPRTQRRLAAIMAVDIADYSRMMGADENGVLTALRAIWATRFNPVVAEFRGRIVKMMGDGALVEFGSAVDAVECAVRIQMAMQTHNEARRPQEPITFRIGVNLGDIVIEGEDIFGDGVNIAARLETAAPKGGVLVSEAVHAQIKGKVSVDFADMGALALKNIAVPVSAWSWGGDATAAEAEAAQDDVPSIAVLPFNNMSGDPEEEYFSDGISEDIITDLSKISGLMVVARNSSFAYKGKTPDPRVMGRELGVTSVLEGSIRRAGNRVRITAQLTDARSGHHLWAERYDRDLTDIFAVQDEVTLQIVAALRVVILPMESAFRASGRKVSVEAHDLVLRGRELLFTPKQDRQLIEDAIKLFERAIALDPGYGEAYAGLSGAYVLDYHNRYTETPDALGLATHFAALAAEHEPENQYVQLVNAMAALLNGNLDRARTAAQHALVLSPNFAPALSLMGSVEVFQGRPQAGIPFYQRAMRLDPVGAPQFRHFLGMAYMVDGQYDLAEAAFRERIRAEPWTDMSRAFLAACLGNLGRHDDARQAWEELMRVNPRYSFSEHMSRLPFQNPTVVAAITAGLTTAGLLV